VVLAPRAQLALQSTDHRTSRMLDLTPSATETLHPGYTPTNNTLYSLRLDKRRTEDCFAFATTSNELVDCPDIHTSVFMHASDDVSLSLLFGQVVEMVGKSGLWGSDI